MLRKDVIDLAQRAHSQYWKNTGNESEGDKLASLVTSKWQQAILGSEPKRFVAEFAIADGLREKIDVVDIIDGIAYELKVSPNNTHFEFYKDIFKVIVARDNSLSKLGTLVFITPASGARKMQRGLGKAVIEHSKSFGLVVEVCGI